MFENLNISLELLLVVSLVGNGLLLLLFFSTKNKQKIIVENKFDKELTLLRESLSREQQANTGLVSKIDYLEAEKGELIKTTATLQERLYYSEGKSEDLRQVQTEVEQVREKLNQAQIQVAQLENEKKQYLERLEEQQAFLKQSKEQLTSQFQLLANQILEEKSQRFTKQNQENLQSLIKPVREQLDQFKQSINDNYLREAKERSSLSLEIKQLKTLNQQISDDAINLTNALKGNTKIQGQWGEFILTKTLELCGLRQGIEFDLQQTFRDEQNTLKQPDVIVHLPENKHIVIDAKVSLNAYESYAVSIEEQERVIAMKSHIDSIKNHIKGLSEKNYQELYGLNSLDFVLMFVPIEPAFLEAVRYEPDLYDFAFDRNIILVSGTTLLACLRTVANFWQFEQQNKNAMQIAKEAGALYDKFVAFTDDLELVGKRLNSALSDYDNAMKKLVSGRGNLINKTNKLKELGVKSSKQLSATLIELDN